jgi:hypothetical protein
VSPRDGTLRAEAGHHSGGAGGKSRSHGLAVAGLAWSISSGIATWRGGGSPPPRWLGVD